MEKIFTLRVDLESQKGISERLPKLLDLLNEYETKASFYITMGGESNIFELMNYRGKMPVLGERKIKIFSFAEKLRMALFPKDFVTKNIKVIQRIIDEGHELGLHGWKHREWTRGLHRINTEKAITKSMEKFEKLFGKKPISWASPGFNVNQKVLEILESDNIQFISDFQGSKIENYGKIKNIPITILGENKTPIIEYLASMGKNDEEISEKIISEIKNNEISSMYIHGMFEARFKLDVLRKIFEFVKKNKIENKRIIDYQ